MAASKCPKCGYGLEVRDGFGDMLPLSHCSTCDSYYPTKVGACKWCGTPPERAPIGPYLWKGIGVAAFVGMAWGAWLVHDDPPADVSAARMEAMLKPDSSAIADSASALVTIASAGNVSDVAIDSAAPSPTDVVVPDSGIALATVARIDTVSVSATGVVPQGDPVALVSPTIPAAPPPPTTTASVAMPIDSVPLREPDPPAPRVPVRTPEPVRAPVLEPARGVERPAPRASGASARVTKPRAKVTAKPPSRAVASAKTPPKAAAKTVAKAPPKRTTKAVAAAPKGRSSTRWVSSIARNWVVVRASASPQARIIASIGPNTRVQLGESRGDWRRIKAKGLAGWVDHRSFFAMAGPSRSGGRLAAR